jgi:putative FmdB family regulatory protein
VLGGGTNARKARERSMPTYEFKCNDCGAEFEVIASLAEYERMKLEHAVKCTSCGRFNVEPEIVSFEVQTERKSA